MADLNDETIPAHLERTHKTAGDAVTFADLGTLFGVATDRPAPAADAAATTAAPAAPEAFDYDKLAAAIARQSAGSSTAAAQ